MNDANFEAVPETGLKVTVPEALGRRPRVVLGMPTFDEVKADFMMSLLGAISYSCLALEFSPANPRGCYVQVSRNDIVFEHINTTAEWIMWIDRDIEFERDAILRLMADAVTHKLDIVGATYVRRSPPYRLMGKPIQEGAFLPMEGLVEMEWMPAGFLLTRMDVYRRIKAPWFWLTHGPDGHCDVGDDVYFCMRAREAGMKIFCDTELTSKIRHHNDVGLAPPVNQFT